jgi:sulfite reductase (NADPH) flavoprotein alpha-component
MTIQQPAPGMALIPESAPFTSDQRAWLNGFFAGVLSLDAAQAPAGPDFPNGAAKPA